MTHNVSDGILWRRAGEYLDYLRGRPNLETTVDSRGAGMAISFKKGA